MSAFYDKIFAKVNLRLAVLQNRYGCPPDVVSELDFDEIEDFTGALLELRSQLRKLQWFGEMNRRGFVKITKKFDKKVPDAAGQQYFISTKLDPQPFARGDNIPPVLTQINQWLSVLRGAQSLADSNNDRSSRSLARFASRVALNLSQAQLETLDRSIRENDTLSLRASLDSVKPDSERLSQLLLLNLLQRSISARSKGCVALLLDRITDLNEPSDINSRNCLHRLVIHIGRTRLTPAAELSAETPAHVGNFLSSEYLRSAFPATGPASTQDFEQQCVLGKNDEQVQILVHLLDHIKPDSRDVLRSRDYFGRLPLHYAAQYGFAVGCEIILAKMQEWRLFDPSSRIDVLESQDAEGFAPFHLSAIGGHNVSTQILLNATSSPADNGSQTQIKRTAEQSGAVLALAMKMNYKAIVQMLVDAGVDINWTDANGESALHFAARFGHDECARILLSGSKFQKADIEAAENLYAWTPLHVAAVDGHLTMAQLLVHFGADIFKPDSSGWTAKEHAALRGHMSIARMLASHMQEDDTVAPLPQSAHTSISTAKASVEAPRSDRTNGRNRADDAVKRFGHAYLTDESIVLVSLGSLDVRQDVEAVTIDHALLPDAHATQLDTALSLVISADGATGDAATVDLPAQENIATEPITFRTKNMAKVRLLFDLVPTYAGPERSKYGRAVALLSSVKPNLGSQRMNLQGDVHIPIVSNSYDIIGTVNFSFQVITPFQHPRMETVSKNPYWKKLSPTMLIGHRGLGQNRTSNKSLQLGENTLSSFIAASNLGAQYVEFDVQLTKDHVPVIYHDFLVSETGIDAPVHALTLEQFLHINPDRSRNESPESSNSSVRSSHQRNRSNSFTPNRSRSMGYVGDGRDAMDERMKHTRDFKEKGFKPNSRGNFIQAPFATLEDLFCKLPESVGFNIEMKYPMLQESVEQEMDTYAVELNSFCNTVLAKVYDLVENRHIIFSSFNPDICLCLRFKQPSIPILFLSDSGTYPVGDIRASSLQEAIRFASRWNLLGVVSAAEPFINSPRLVRVVKENGLVCVSYGAENNDPAQVQVRDYKQASIYVES